MINLNLLVFAAVAAAVWSLVIYFWPRLILSVYKRAAMGRGFGDGPIPVNTIRTQPRELFADPIAALSAAGSNVLTVGVNHDTLLSAGWLDLRPGPLVLHVPDMGGRYYSVQFTDPAKNVVFAYVGTRATGTQAGDFLIAGRSWQGQAPDGMRRISPPNNSVIVVGRVLVKNESDLPKAHDLSQQIKVTPLGEWRPG
jgi:hypothetical protein